MTSNKNLQFIIDNDLNKTAIIHKAEIQIALHRQSSTKALEKWGHMTHTIENNGDIGKFSGVTYVILPFVNLKFVGTWAPTA